MFCNSYYSLFERHTGGHRTVKILLLFYFTLFFHSRVKIILSTENRISLSLFLSHTYLYIYIYIYQQCYQWNLHIDLIVMLFVWLFVGSQRVWKPTVQKADKKKLCSYLHCWITCALLTTLIFHFGSYCYNQCTVIVAPLEGWYGKSQWPFCTFWHKKMTRHHRPNVLVRRQCLMCTMFSSGHHTGQCCRSGWLGEEPAERLEGKQRLSQWNLIRLSTLLVSSLSHPAKEGGEGGFVFYGVYSNAQRVKLFLEPRV